MIDEVNEDQEAEPKSDRGGTVRMAAMGAGIFVIVLAAQVAAPPITSMLYGGANQEVDEPLEGEDGFPIEAEISIADLDPAIYTPLDPPLIVSLVDASGASRFLQLSVQAMARDQNTIDDIKIHAPALRNSFLFLISEWAYEDIATIEGKEDLRSAMLAEAQNIMEENTGDAGVEELYFTSLVVQ